MTEAAPAISGSKVGWIGLGRMGVPITGRLIDHGISLVVHNRTVDKAGPLRARGAEWSDSPRALATSVGPGVIFTLLTDGRAVRSVLFGRRGVAAGAAPGTLVVDLSTIAPDESRAIAERLAARGIHFVDAPLGGSTPAAAEGRLLVYAGGDPADVDRVRPLLSVFGRRIERIGPVGAGTSMKLVNNLLTVGYVVLAAEALALAGGLDVDRDRALDLLLDGGGQSQMLAHKRASLSRREYPTQFSLSLADKDLHLIGRAARSVGGSLPVTRELRRVMDEAMRAGLGDQDFAVVFERVLAHFGTPNSSAGSERDAVAPTGGTTP
jgi:3-hydroxyisobutyrate dehydrogenase-like beta-hydroxyacid dehydrogenase